MKGYVIVDIPESCGPSCEIYEECRQRFTPCPIKPVDKLMDQIEKEKRIIAKFACNTKDEGSQIHATGYVNGLNRALDLMRKECADETAEKTN